MRKSDLFNLLRPIYTEGPLSRSDLSEMTNFAPNSPIWGTPGNKISTNLATKTFGVVNATATGYNPRQLQFAFKLYY